jgi:CheY-like chemotaxis protein
MTTTTDEIPSAPDGHKTCVLIVDDEEDVRESLRDVVEMMGCSALLAASAREGLALLANRRLCLVVLDLMMPGMTGAEMLETMRRDPAYAQMPVVISTSAPERAPRDVPVLAKPIDIEAFFGWMKDVCQCGSAERSARPARPD